MKNTNSSPKIKSYDFVEKFKEKVAKNPAVIKEVEKIKKLGESIRKSRLKK